MWFGKSPKMYLVSLGIEFYLFIPNLMSLAFSIFFNLSKNICKLIMCKIMSDSEDVKRYKLATFIMEQSSSKPGWNVVNKDSSSILGWDPEQGHFQ